MKRAAVNLALLFFALLVVFFSIWGPEALARYKDKGVLNQIRLQQEEGEGEGRREGREGRKGEGGKKI